MLFIIEVGKLVIEISILIVTHLDNAIFHPERVTEIFTCIMMIDLNNPIIDITPIKYSLPSGIMVFMRSGTGSYDTQNDKYCN